MFIVRPIGIPTTEETELRILELLLQNQVLEVGAILGHILGCLVGEFYIR